MEPAESSEGGSSAYATEPIIEEMHLSLIQVGFRSGLSRSSAPASTLDNLVAILYTAGETILDDVKMADLVKSSEAGTAR